VTAAPQSLSPISTNPGIMTATTASATVSGSRSTAMTHAPIHTTTAATYASARQAPHPTAAKTAISASDGARRWASVVRW
jgi:hypothetical protein